ncbi:MAG TPA: VOC family protein [Steroidobacteraceae bacterium]|nr:VOC family protein [Steroidobacteraceae bacterium]
MSNIHKSGAVLFAKDAQRVAAFYQALAGMKVTHASKDLIVLESPGHQLVVHPIPAKIARGIDIAVPPKRRTQAAVKLVFAVKSIAAARAAAPAYGGELNPPERMFEVRGFRACDGHDPEGNVIQFREPAAAAATAAPRKGRAKVGVDYATVRELALALPDVVDSSTHRAIGFKARGKLLACKAVNRSAEPDSLMLRVGAAERDRLLAAMPEVCYLTPHYQTHEVVLVRMKMVDRKTLQELLGLAWNFVTVKPAKRRKPGSVFRYL